MASIKDKYLGQFYLEEINELGSIIIACISCQLCIFIALEKNEKPTSVQAIV